jgi:hypothetical protein
MSELSEILGKLRKAPLTDKELQTLQEQVDLIDEAARGHHTHHSHSTPHHTHHTHSSVIVETEAVEGLEE